MTNVHVLTEDTLLMDLLYSGLEENEVEEKFDTIKEMLEEDRYVIKANGTYIFGQLTSLYLKLTYNINSLLVQVE
ncbi:MAG TPA: hypothetical protein VIK86_00960 [Candidatus Paceibacterota bacterium]